ncbi:CBS domain-containing protein [Parapedobacter defluvii]|uniref:CBS domain-containing protein n=1 Tax=Parapedobacter defluvii TaxID=2045106 RepID=UPI0033414617
MEKNIPIAAIVLKSKVTVNPQDRISAVYRLMKKFQLKHIPVIDVDKIVGIISRKDILHLGFGYEYDGREDVEIGMFDMLQADQVMVKKPHFNFSRFFCFGSCRVDSKGRYARVARY